MSLIPAAKLNSTKFGSTLLISTLALISVGCNKNANKPNTATTASSTTTTVVSSTSTTVSTTSATAMTDAPLSATSATAATSAPASTVVLGNPKDTVKAHIDALRAGNVKNAMTYLETHDAKAMSQYLVQTIPQYKTLKSVKYAEPQFNQDKSQAQVIITFSGKTLPQPLEVPYALVSTPTGWKILADAPAKTTPPVGKDGKVQTELMTASEAAALKAANGKNGVTKDKNGKVVANLSPNGQPMGQLRARTEPIIMTTTKKGTPEDTVKQAMNTLVTGSTKDAAKFYKSKNPKLNDIVANQQVLLQQNLQSIQIVDTKYSKNKTHADVNVVLIPFAPAPEPVKATKHSKKKAKAHSAPQPKPEAGVIQLEKKAGVWKILAD